MSVFEFKDKDIIHECMALGDVCGRVLWQYVSIGSELDNGPKLMEELCVAFLF